MGYAIFTARKLMLTNRINQLNARIMQLSQQQQTLADNAARLERAMANTRNIFSSIGNIFQSAISMQQMSALQALSQNPDPTKAQQMLTQALSGQNNFMSSPAGVSLMLTNQCLEMVNSNKLQEIKNAENEIELQRKSLETQVQAARAELEAVEKQEGQEIKNSAPKFA